MTNNNEPAFSPPSEGHGGGSPDAQRPKKDGNYGYAGYQYQIDVTIWVALDLMLVKDATDALMIEPRSEEDIEATVSNPGALLDMQTEGEQMDLVLQVKTRSGAPWTSTAIADVLLGKETEVTTSKRKGKRKRIRPLEMLEANPRRRFIFITNEASEQSLRPHEGEHLFDFPEVVVLPPNARKNRDAKAQSLLAPRILLLTGLTSELLILRIAGLLARHGHVPEPKHDACVRDLRDEVRRRITGHEGGRWSRQDLLGMLRSHGGSVTPTRDMDRYVPPSSFDRIKARLDTAHAVVITGPSGTGKTLTADFLELGLRRCNPPFDVVGEEYGPSRVRQNLTRPDPVLFHLRDPWGGNRLTPSADRWSGELPKLLESAGPGRKFLITSRSDVLQSIGCELIKDLQPYMVSIEIADYGPVRLSEIYDRIAGDLTGPAQKLSQLYRAHALKQLKRPYEVKRFLGAISVENPETPRKVEDIVADSQIDAISRVIAEQIFPLGLDGIHSAAVIWAILNARGSVSREFFTKLLRRLRTVDSSMRPDVDGLIDFLVAGQNLRQDGSALAFYHPRVEDGLRLAFMRQPREVEVVIGKIVEVLVSWDLDGSDWGVETALGVLRAAARLEGFDIEIGRPTQARLDEYLVGEALAGDKSSDFEQTLRDLIRFGSFEHVPSRLARILIDGDRETAPNKFLERWISPNLEIGEKDLLRNDHRTKPLIERFIREVLPFSSRRYTREVVSLLHELAVNLEPAYWDALEVVAGPGGPNGNIDAIVRGALIAEAPNYERAIDRFARSEAEADDWMEHFSGEIYRAEEHVVDADLADHQFDEPAEQYYNAREGMKEVLRLRRKIEGVAWIINHRHRRLLSYALSDLIGNDTRKPVLTELQILFEAADDGPRDKAWSVALQHWDSELRPFLYAELARTDAGGKLLRQRLIEAAAIDCGDGDMVHALATIAAAVSIERRIELAYDVVSASIEDDSKGEIGFSARRDRANRLVETYPQPESDLSRALIDILAGENVFHVSSTLSVDARTLLKSILPGLSTDVAGPLACLGAAASVDVGDAVVRLLAAGDSKNGLMAVQALLIAGGGGLRDGLRSALRHKRYPVRRKALRSLAPDATIEERSALLTSAKDPCADMRVEFAQLMHEHKWPEAIDSLIKLLEDQRNFGSDLSPAASWSRFSVARAAAKALGAYDSLPKHAVDALIAASEASSEDPFVACAALSALACQDDHRVAPLLITALESPGLDGAPSFYPRRQAAAWAICDRVANGKLTSLGSASARIAKEADPPIAGPLLVAYGVLGADERSLLLDELDRLGEKDRKDIVHVASVALGDIDAMALDIRERILLRMASDEASIPLSHEERSIVQMWSQELKVETGFSRFLAWLAQAAFGLPLSAEVGDIRAYHLPDRIGVLTMRSISPYREEIGTVDDGA